MGASYTAASRRHACVRSGCLYEQLRIRFYIHQNFPGDDFGISKIKVKQACLNKLDAAMRKAMEPVYKDVAGRVGQPLIDEFVKETGGVAH
jgi:hypothetical protein